MTDFVKNLFVGKFRPRCDNETSIMAVAEKVTAKMPDQSRGEKYATTQLSASNGLAERTLRYDTQNLYKTRITSESTVWPWFVKHAGFCVTWYARRAGGITPFRAANDRDYTQEIVPFAEIV